MSLDTEDEILQDFLVEAGELLDGLSEQLVELERNPDDRDLLNAVFRSFHTIKGGAGFLNLNNLVAVCHRAEDVFNVLRQGQRRVDSTLMDAVLRVLDVVTRMFNEVRGGEEPGPADPQLLTLLESLAMPDEGGEDQPAPRAVEPAPAQPEPAAAESTDDSGDITDEEFEALLDAMQAGGTHPALPSKPAASASAAAPGPEKDEGEITEDEFESLLDELHGKGTPPGNGATSGAPAAGTSGGSGNDEIITEDEFENLLDELHGKGQAPRQAPVPAPPAAQASTPAPAAKASPAPSAPAETSVRVDTRRLDDIMNLVGELVLVRNRLSTLRQQVDDERLAPTVGDLELVTSDLQAAVMQTRMQPIKKVFGRFPRLVRDLARGLGKTIELEMRGEETDLDKNLVEALADPLIHLVRNSCDHGIESPEERSAAGKPATGRIKLSAEQEGDHILLIIADDGKGMDPDALRRKVVEKGLMDAETAARLDDTDCFNLIFTPGFSTKEEISDVSGRGVGMDVVKTRISQLNGTVDISSQLGVGTTLRIKVPLTLAILPTLMVTLDQRKFALPMSVVKEIFELDMSRTKEVDGRQVVMVRNKAMPLFFLDRWIQRINDVQAFGEEGGNSRPQSQQVVTVVLGHQPIGFVVDDVVGLEEVVIKPLGSMLQGLPGLAGSTITGDGRISLIIDIPGLVKSYGGML